MKVQTKLMVATLALGVAGVAACGGEDSFSEGDLAAVQFVSDSPLELQMPPSANRMQAQRAVTFVSDGTANLKVESIEFGPKPERLLVRGKQLDIPCDFDAGSAPTFDSSGACPDNSVCWDYDGICREVGVSESSFTMEPDETHSIDLMIIPGEGSLDCPDAPAGDEDVPSNYCGEMLIKTNAQNSNEPTIKNGDIRLFFTYVQGSGRIEIDPQSISFSGINVGQSDSRDIKITNTHSAQPLIVDSIRAREHVDRFTVSAAPSLPIEIGPGDSETWTLSFTPSPDWDGTSFGTDLEVKSSANNERVSLIPVQVSSEASRPAIKLSSDVLRFDSEATQSFTISNEGAASLTLRGFTVLPSTNSSMYTISEGGNAITGQYTKVLGAGESQDYTIAFSAGSEPGGIGTLEILYNYFVNEQSQNDMAAIELLGDVGDAPIGMVSPDVFSFRAASGESATQSFVIRNVGTEALVASNVEIVDTIPGSAETFSTTLSNGTTIEPGTMQAFTVSYQGNDEDDDRAAIRIETNTAGEPMQVTLIARAGETHSGEAVVTPAFGDTAVAVNAEARFNALLSTGFSESSIDQARWTLLERPAGSQTFVDKIGPDATIFPDTAGAYKIALTITEDNTSSQAVYEFSAQ